MYANIAVNAPVENTFDYHIPPELEGKLGPGHLVQVGFGTSMQHGIVLSIHDQVPPHVTKPVIARLDPQPVLNEAQIEVARWMSSAYLAPLGLCLWMWLPPGLTGYHDILVDLAPGADQVEHGRFTPPEQEVLALLRRRGSLRGHQLNLALPGKPWRAVVDALAKAGVITREPTLAPPRVRPKIVQTVALAIAPEQISLAARHLERPSKRADLLEWIAAQPDGHVPMTDALKGARATRPHLEKLVEEGVVTWTTEETVALAIDHDEVGERLEQMRRIKKPLHILNVLARAGDAMDVSWLYAQADASLADLKRLEDENLIVLGEKQAWRDSLAERDFVPLTPPRLTPEQGAAWETIRAAVVKSATRRAGVTSAAETVPPESDAARWKVPQRLYARLTALPRQRKRKPTRAQDALWEALSQTPIPGCKFRRQHEIERFVVDFFCPEAQLVIEVGDQLERDYDTDEREVRRGFLESVGLRVLQFADDALADPDAVIAQIGAVAAEQLTALGPDGDDSIGAKAPAFLLHGVTGSGKTEIYLRAIELTLALGRSAIFLVPEIALTAQTVRRVAARFPGRVAVVHSGLSEGERYDTWRRAREGLVQVVVGARSALFAPLRDVGLVVIDEEHDTSYKQSPPIPPPYYHARQVAEVMMRLNRGVLILGSATPDVETVYRSTRREIERLELPRRIMGHRVRIREQAEREGVQPHYHPDAAADDAVMIDLPPVSVIDMRSELKAGNTSIFSTELQEAVASVLDRRQQAILFINRRGQSTYVFCRDCGYIAACPRCDTPLTYHRQGQALRCHRCGFSQPEPSICPQCESRRIKYFGAGTQQVESALTELFPRARVVRWDADTASSPEAHEAILQRFIERKADIMVGTQMVAKGLDLPLVTLVGVVSADIGLALPDFRAGERTFQVLTQVAGRAGRGLLGGRVILQTYQPEHYTIKAAAHHDYADFYQREIAFRRELGYPPYRRLVRILFRFPSDSKAQAEAERAAALMRARLQSLHMTGTELIGPAPCFFTRENTMYRWHLLLRGPDPAEALRGFELPRGWYVDVDPVDVL